MGVAMRNAVEGAEMMGGRGFAVDELKPVWERILRDDVADGTLSYGVRRFREEADRYLDELSEALDAGSWQPHPLVEMVLPGAKRRVLHIPVVEDRIVARRVLEMITPLVDPSLGRASFGYRPGLGVTDAVQEVVGLREEGFSWVVRTDVADCFPSVKRDLAVRALKAMVPDEELTHLLDLFAARPRRLPGGGLRSLEGVPQGCPLSPLLANLVLRDLDTDVQSAGFPLVRYADDIVIACHHTDDALEALRVASRAAEELGMSLGAKKTAVRSFAEGFTFLGEDFGSRYPPPLDEHRVKEPDEKVVYVAVQGGRVRIQSGRLLVESKDDAVLLDVPTGHVGRVVLFGSVGLSAGARSWALGSDVDVVFASRSGSYQGSLHSGSHPFRPARLRAQLATQGTDRGDALARAIVASKLMHQRTLLMHFNRRPVHDEVAEAVVQLQQYGRLLPEARGQAEIMGVEGAAAQVYFPALGLLVPEGMRFTLRSRRPPRDVVNAALSYLYTILLGECVTALHAAGLDPGIGVLHTPQDNRPSLALDLMEELRPLIVDQVVVNACRLQRLRPEHARPDEGSAVLLTKAGKEILLTAYEQRMNRDVSGALPDYAGSYRRHLHRQAQRLMVSVMNPGTPWTGLSWR